MKVNGDKCHAMRSLQVGVHVNIATAQIEYNKCQKVLGINIDSKLPSEDQINHICKKASKNFNALSKISYYMDPLKQRLLVNEFSLESLSFLEPKIWEMLPNDLENISFIEIRRSLLAMQKVYSPSRLCTNIKIILAFNLFET